MTFGILLLSSGLSASQRVTTSLSERDVSCLRQVVWQEARGESREGQRAVAHVVVNRSAQRKKSLCEIVKERGQFKLGHPPTSFTVYLGTSDPTNGATYFKNYGGSWGILKFYKKIGKHYFYGR